MEEFMNALNQIILEGNVVRQPEKRTCKNGSKFCYVPIAVNRSYKGGDGNYVNEVSFFDVAVFGSTAELCEKWCPKGRGIRVVGRLRQNVSNSNGKKQSKVEIVAEHVEFKPFKKKEEQTDPVATKKQKLEMLSQVSQVVQQEANMKEEDEMVF